MSNFGVMVSDIADDINKTNLNSQIKRMIVASMKSFRNQRFKFNKASSTFTTSDGQAEYPLPDGYIGDELIEVLDGNFNDVLTKRDYSWVAANDNHTSYKSEPRVYAIIDGSNLRLFPKPSANEQTSASGTVTTSGYKLINHYHKDLNASGIAGAISRSSSDDVTNAWMTDGFDLIRIDATIRVYTNVIRGPEAKAEARALLPLRKEALKALKKEYVQAVGSGSMQNYF